MVFPSKRKYVFLFIFYGIALVLCKKKKESKMAAAKPSENNKPKDINKLLKPPLKNIVAEKITLNENEAKQNLKIMEETVNALIKAMKEVDPFFKEIYQRVLYTGSYYDGVRITTPREFDLNLVLRLPFKPDEVLISQTKDAPAFFQYKILKSITDLYALHPKWTPNLYQKLLKFFNKENCLLRDAIQRWIQGIIAKAIESTSFKIPSTVKELKPSQSGPAFTWYIITRSGHQIDVDLVPVIDGSHMNLPRGIQPTNRFNQLPQTESKAFYLVPKPAKGASACSDKASDYWRIAFPEAEKKLISSIGCVKLLIKLFKLLRDRQNWKDIASYYIKTLFLLELDQHPDPNYWKEDELGNLFMKMLKKFREYINQRALPYYFTRKANLLNGLSAPTASNIVGRLDKIISTIEKDPEKITSFL